MNIGKSLKFHVYAYVKPYLLFWLLLILCCTVVLLSGKTDFLSYTALALILLSYAFSFMIGVYEYAKLAKHYINLHTMKYEFYFGGIAFSFVQSLFQTFMMVAGFALLYGFYPQEPQLFPYTAVSALMISYVIHMFVFTIANTMTILIGKTKTLHYIVPIVLIILLIFYFWDIIGFFNIHLVEFYSDPHLMMKLLPMFLIGELSLLLFNEYLFVHKKNNLYQN